MKIAVFSTKPYDRQYLTDGNDGRHELTFFEARLDASTAGLLAGHEAACVFVHDHVNREVLEKAAAADCRLFALRCAGFNNVDVPAAKEQGVRVARVPAYSPHGVAEFAAGLILTLNRRYHRAWNRVRERNFSLSGLIGFDLKGKTVGVVGTGKIGAHFCRIMRGFDCEVLAFDVRRDESLADAGVHYVELDELWARSHIISLHCPLTPQTRHIVDQESLGRMRDGVMLINTSRGELVDTQALIEALKHRKLGSVGLDVYEEEEGVFYEDLSDRIVGDDELNLLLAYPNVLVTSHQGFLTHEALTEITRVTYGNIDDFAAGRELPNAVA